MRTKCYTNREISWLQFNERVLEEAGNEKVPLAERLTFLSIYQSNLDEFFMVRVGTLMDQQLSKEVIRENKTNLTSREQVDAILDKSLRLEKKKTQIYEALMSELQPHGVTIINFNCLSDAEQTLLKEYFEKNICPFLSPMIVGKQQPFPFLNNRDLYAVVLLETHTGKNKLGIVPCTNAVFPRLIEVPGRAGTFMLCEELILHFMSELFHRYTLKEKSIMRITRNADIDATDVYDEDLDYRDMMEHLVKQRTRLSPVRLELSRPLTIFTQMELAQLLKIDTRQILQLDTPLDMSFVFQLQNFLHDKTDLFYDRRSPRTSATWNMKQSIIEQIEEKDRLLFFPFESMKPFIKLLHEVAEDSSVVSIKMTLYRVAEKSKIIDALIEAAENGKEVVVVVELRARFDEANNIELSRRLEEAGCRIIYGLDNYKVHSKLCLITRKTKDGLSYISQIGTGNYNEKTARLYTDFSLMTANYNIGSEVANVFSSLLLGETLTETEYLLVAPNCLQNKILAMINEEISHAKNGEAAYVGIKINSLTDKVIIEKLIDASIAGVKVELIIRGICCLVPGIKDYTQNISVISIVGRFLEHSRIYRFGVGEREKIYIASADFMTRNTVRRVEVAAPIYDEDLKNRLRHIFTILMSDTEKGKVQNNKREYLPQSLDTLEINSQEFFYWEAYESAKAYDD